MNHIISAIDPEKSWCGVVITQLEIPFKNLDQVATNGAFPSKKPICKYCIDVCAQLILNNIENCNDEES